MTDKLKRGIEKAKANIKKHPFKSGLVIGFVVGALMVGALVLLK